MIYVVWYISRFYENHRFPGVIGCIDCTHIAIFPPQVHDAVNLEHLYVNRKGYHSINVQLVSIIFLILNYYHIITLLILFTIF